MGRNPKVKGAKSEVSMHQQEFKGFFFSSPELHWILNWFLNLSIFEFPYPSFPACCFRHRPQTCAAPGASGIETLQVCLEKPKLAPQNWAPGSKFVKTLGKHHRPVTATAMWKKWWIRVRLHLLGSSPSHPEPVHPFFLPALFCAAKVPSTPHNKDKNANRTSEFQTWTKIFKSLLNFQSFSWILVKLQPYKGDHENFIAGCGATF